ncbi:DUF6894 family protein [Sphingomonas hylomeconis]|uniref:DUF6894 family protein n=1 Tax=Sphingomonas hylomeconis TaxID=1395958 RepID=A0ABV7SXD6_9SPHN|nr:hypothetical protein [Sphingomonas hylomeconis]
MARYFFHLHERGTITVDEEGRVFATLAAAYAAAIRDARAIMCDQLGEGKLCLACLIEIVDDTGACVARVPFGDAVDVTGA